MASRTTACLQSVSLPRKRLGWNVGFSGRSQESVNRASDWFAAAGLDAERLSGHVMAVDDPQAVRQAWQGTVKLFGRIDVWINNAGRGINRQVLDLTDEDIDEMMAVNVKSALYGMQAILPHFKERGEGHF